MENNEIRELAAKYFKPQQNYLLLEFIENAKTEGGIYIPESVQEKAIAYPIVAIGPDLDTNKFEVKVGDWIAINGTQYYPLSLFGKKFIFVRDHEIMSIVDMNYIKVDYDMRTKPRTQTPPLVN